MFTTGIINRLKRWTTKGSTMIYHVVSRGSTIIYHIVSRVKFYRPQFLLCLFTSGAWGVGESHRQTLEAGGAGGTPLAVTQEDCLVGKNFKISHCMILCIIKSI